VSVNNYLLFSFFVFHEMWLNKGSDYSKNNDSCKPGVENFWEMPTILFNYCFHVAEFTRKAAVFDVRGDSSDQLIWTQESGGNNDNPVLDKEGSNSSEYA